MYPRGKLRQLAVRKSRLRKEIALERAQLMQSATRAMQPVAWLERAHAWWRRASPFVLGFAIPLGALFRRTPSPRLQKLRALLRWAPIIVRAVNVLSSVAGRPSRR